MQPTRVPLLAVLALAVACGGPDGSTDYTSCERSNSCRGDACLFTDDCFLDECEWELTYRFAGEDYESRCLYGPEYETTTYPRGGGRGERVIERDVQECFYWSEVRFFDFSEERTCTETRDCRIQMLDCEPASGDRPTCRVVDESACRLRSSPS